MRLLFLFILIPRLVLAGSRPVSIIGQFAEERTKVMRDGITFRYFKRPIQSSLQVVRTWQTQFLGSRVLWLFDSKEDFNEILNRHSIPSELRRKLELSFREEVGALTYAEGLTSFFPTLMLKSKAVVVEVPVWMQMPKSLVHDMETYQFRYRLKAPLRFFPPFSGHSQKGEFHSVQKLFDAAGIKTDDPHFAVYDKSTLLSPDGVAQLVLTPAVWPILSDESKAVVTYLAVYAFGDSEGLGVQIEVTEDNISQIACRYAFGSHFPQVIEHRLGEILSREGGRPTWVDLEQVMPPFVQKYAGYYSDVPWANCYSTALNVGSGEDYLADEYISVGFDLLMRVSSRYRYVEPSEDLRTGDILLYTRATHDGSQRLEIFHADTYVWDATGDLVLTKFGMIKVAPVRFATRQEGLKLYVNDQPYQMMALRQITSGELRIDQVPNPVFYHSDPAFKGFKLFEPSASKCDLF